MTQANSIGETTMMGKIKRPGTGTVCLIWLAGLLYAALCMQHWIARPVGAGLVFNEMLTNLLHGRFDINPATIGSEAFVYRGHSYTYFGVFCAFLRLPLLLTGHIATDMTGPSVLTAAAISLACRLAIVATILNKAPTVNPVLRWAVLVAVATNGESIQYLVPSLYQEVVSWACALASLFVLLAVRLALGLGKSGAGIYAAMALTAGLTLLCRVTFGVGLCCALAFMAAAEILWSRDLSRPFAARLRKLAPAAAILILFAGLVSGVNYERWENPLLFMPLQYQKITDQEFPDRLLRVERDGAINLRRVPFSLQYYFAPIWAVTDGSGEFLLHSQQVELFDGVEFPPGSLLLSDSVICILAAMGVRTIVAKPRRLAEPALARAALIGLAVPTGLMLTLIYLAFRYRMEFYPALDFAAGIGLADLVWRETPAPKWTAPVFACLCASAMVVALVSFLSYVLIGVGPAKVFYAPRGWIGLLEDKLAGKKIYRAQRVAAPRPDTIK